MRMPRNPVSLAAIVLLGALGWAWAGRVGHPADLEWTEGRAVAAGWRVLQGLPLYDPPTLEWAPVAEPPGHPLALAALFAVVGPGVPAARALSVLSAVFAAVGLGLATWGSTRDRAISVGAGGCWLGCWAVAGTGWDVAGPHALGCALIGGALAATSAGGPAWSAVGGALTALACATSLPMVPLAVGLAALQGSASRQEGLPWVAGLTLGGVAGLAGVASVGGAHGLFLIGSALRAADPGTVAGALQALGDGLGVLLPFAMLGLLARPTTRPGWDVAGPMGAGVLLAWLALAWGPMRSGAEAWSIGVGVGALGAGCARLALDGVQASGRSRVMGLAGAFGLGGLLLDVPPGTAASLPVFGVAILGSVVALHAVPGSSTLLALAVTGQLVMHTVRTASVEPPSPADLEAHGRLVRVLQRAPGPLWSPYATWLPVEVGGEPSAHAGALEHLRAIRAFPDDLDRFDTDVREGRFGAVITAGEDPALGDLSATALRTRIVRPAGAGVPRAGRPVTLDGVRVPLGSVR